MDYSLPGSSLHWILQARTPESVAIPFSRGSSWPRDQNQGSYISGRLFAIWATKEADAKVNSIGFYKHWVLFAVAMLRSVK